MYSTPDHYDDGPGSSAPRQWSPGYPSPRHSADFAPQFAPSGQHQRRRQREASDISVEALDLADYATTLRRQGPDHDQYDFEDPTQLHGVYPPPPPVARPFSTSMPYHRSQFQNNPFISPPHSPLSSPSPPGRPFSSQSRDTFAAAPSMVSGETATSRSSHDIPRHMSLPPPAGAGYDASAWGYGRRSAPAAHQGIFAPAPEANRSRQFFSQNAHANSVPNLETRTQSDDGIDVRNFPRWSRSWYADGNKSKVADGGPPIIFPDFDAPSSSHGGGRGVMYGAPTVSGTGSGSPRDVLPWGAQLGDPDAPVPDEIKEERLRRLEREFGPRPSRSAADAPTPTPEDEPPEVGSVDDRGRLVTVGPKKRLATRILQVLLSLGAAGAGIGAALLLHPKPPAPPAGTVPTIILDALGVITFLVLLYILVFRSCCTRNKSPAQSGLGMPGMPGGLMVLPVSQQTGKKKKGKKGGPPVPGDVQVNLIVDPSAFGMPQQPSRSRRRGGYSEISGDDDFDDRPPPPRKSVFHGMAIEQAWRRARSFQKQLIAIDIVMVLAWGGAFVYATFLGKNCPPGQFGGWCDAYNLSLAGACLLSVFFCLSAFFDIRDLRMSAQNPRTRT